MRVAIVGCGKIADQHVHAIRRIDDCIIVGLCDRELLMARQLGERFGINACFTDLQELLETTTPDVVHITTPPQSHYSLAKQCLESGSHVYLEKPFTITAREAESLIRMAERRDLKITAGHNLQFTPETLEMRQLLAQGFLGGKPVHLESHFSYDLGDTTYVGALLGNRQHWVRQLPGQLLHNIISHGLAKLAEFLDDDLIETVDIATGSLTRKQSRAYKSYLTYFIPPLKNAREHLRNARCNVIDFLRRRRYQDFGMKELIERFYNSIRSGSPPPIPYREIILAARIMDEIFAQTYQDRSQRSEVRRQRSAVGKEVELATVRP